MLTTTEKTEETIAKKTHRHRSLGGKVLVVDDDATIRLMLLSTLHSYGYETTHATDGGSAMLQLESEKPDVILLDLMMPGIDGWEFLRLLAPHCQRKCIPTPKVIVLSAHLRLDPQILIEMGATALLTKPFQTNELIDLINHTVNPTEET